MRKTTLCLAVYLSLCVTMCLPVCVCQSVALCLSLFLCLSGCLSDSLPVSSVCLTLCLSVCLGFSCFIHIVSSFSFNSVSCAPTNLKMGHPTYITVFTYLKSSGPGSPLRRAKAWTQSKDLLPCRVFNFLKRNGNNLVALPLVTARP